MNIKISSETQISDLKKARALMKSVIVSNPKSASGWVAAARVEELDGKFDEARAIMAKACSQFGENEDIWLEAARLSDARDQKAIIARAIRQMPQSKKLWLQAAKLEGQESDPVKARSKKRQVLRRALEQVPDDLELWKEAIGLEDEDGARSLLHRAVKCVPHATELWLTLAKLEKYDVAKLVLNDAIQALPTDHTIWTAAAMLEEANENGAKAADMIKRALKKLTKAGVEVTRDEWLKQAVTAEQAETPVTCQAIVDQTLTLGFDSDLAAYESP